MRPWRSGDGTWTSMRAQSTSPGLFPAKGTTPKSKNRIREIPLDAGTLNILSKHKVRQNKMRLLHGVGWNQENLVFCTEKGERLAYIMVYNVFRRMVKKAGLPSIAVQGLRHTHAAFLLRNGHPMNLVAERLEDDPKTVRETYAHVLPSMQREAVKTIERLYE